MFSFMFMVLCIAFYVFIIYQFRVTQDKEKRAKYSYSKELFTGLKETNEARTYSIFFATRRLILCILLVCLQDIHFLARVMLFLTVQIVYFILLIAIKPFDEVQNNLIEALNELLLAFLILILVFYNQVNHWSKGTEGVFVYSILSASCGVLLIEIVSFIVNCVLKCRKKKPVHTEVERLQTDGTLVKALHYQNSISRIDSEKRLKRVSKFKK